MALRVASHNVSKQQLQLPPLLASCDENPLERSNRSALLLTCLDELPVLTEAAFLNGLTCDADDEVSLVTLRPSLLGYSDVGAQLVGCCEKLEVEETKFDRK